MTVDHDWSVPSIGERQAPRPSQRHSLERPAAAPSLISAAARRMLRSATALPTDGLRLGDRCGGGQAGSQRHGRPLGGRLAPMQGAYLKRCASHSWQ